MPAPPPSGSFHDPSDDEILAAARSIVEGRGGAGLGECVESVFFVSGSADLGDRKLRFLFDYWSAIRAGSERGLVTMADIDVADLKLALGNLMLLEAERDGLDAVYRVYGTNVADQAGRDWTGYRVSEMNRVARTPVALLYRACYRAVFETLKPLYSSNLSPPWLQARAWQRLILPICSPEGRCLRFLVGNIAVEAKALSYEDRQRIRRFHNG